ncbi:hypothetical protein [Enterococcus sp. LJL90]
MARKNKTDGFSFEDIVNTEFKKNNITSGNDIDNNIEDNNDNNIDINSDVNNDINPNVNSDSNIDILEKLKRKDETKIKTLLYLDSDVANHLDHYGDMLGKKNGGKSKFSNESIKNFLIQNSLWDKKIANKKRKK